MAGFFDGHERLTELLKEVPAEVKAVLTRGQQVEATIGKRLGELEQKREQASALTEQLRGALEGLEAASTGGVEHVDSAMTVVVPVPR